MLPVMLLCSIENRFSPTELLIGSKINGVTQSHTPESPFVIHLPLPWSIIACKLSQRPCKSIIINTFFVYLYIDDAFQVRLAGKKNSPKKNSTSMVIDVVVVSDMQGAGGGDYDCSIDARYGISWCGARKGDSTIVSSSPRPASRS